MALEKRKGLAGKVAARKAASGQAGTVKRAAEEAARRAATGQAGTVKRAVGDAKRWAATGRGRSNASFMHISPARTTHGAAWCAAEARKLNDSYFPGVSAHISLCPELFSWVKFNAAMVLGFTFERRGQ